MIRFAEDKDLDKLVDMGRQMHGESKYAIYSFDPEKLRNYLSTCIWHDDGILFVYERDGEIIGGFVGWMSEQYFGWDKVAVDLALFVEQDKRGAMAGALLIKRFIEYAKEKGAAQIVISNSTGVDKERVGQLYEKMGMEHVGYVYSLNNKKGE